MKSPEVTLLVCTTLCIVMHPVPISNLQVFVLLTEHGFLHSLTNQEIAETLPITVSR